NPEEVFEDERVFQAIFKAILQLLPELYSDRDPSEFDASVTTGPQVFLCHAKSDGDPLARRIRQHIYEETQLKCFFDLYDIPHGRPVKEFIRESISKSCVLVIWTDQLLESRWCQFEVLEARRQQRPIVVLDAINDQAPRILPFLGNMPVVRWR